MTTHTVRRVTRPSTALIVVAIVVVVVVTVGNTWVAATINSTISKFGLPAIPGSALFAVGAGLLVGVLLVWRVAYRVLRRTFLRHARQTGAAHLVALAIPVLPTLGGIVGPFLPHLN